MIVDSYGQKMWKKFRFIHPLIIWQLRWEHMKLWYKYNIFLSNRIKSFLTDVVGNVCGEGYAPSILKTTFVDVGKM